MLTIAKFGGSSLADGACFRRVRKILLQDPTRQGVVVSAPGRRHGDDTKITDSLYLCHARREQWGPWEEIFDRICLRFSEITRELGLGELLQAELEALRGQVAAGVTRDYLASRGEYFSARIMAAYLGWEFIDSARWLRFTKTGTVDTVRSYGLLRQAVRGPFVTPGFYGADPQGAVRTFPRGGSDITGALAAAALDAALYENWTDVPGILQADPRLLPQAASVRYLTYSELTELSLVGTQVLHEGAVRPVREAGVGLQIRSSLEPEDPGTLILPELPAGISRQRVLCFAGRRERVLVSLSGPELEPGALERLLPEIGVRPDFTTTMLGRQTASLPAGCLGELMEKLGEQPGTVQLRDGISLVTVLIAREAGQGPRGARLLDALRLANIPIAALLRPFSGHTLLLAVPDADYERAIRVMWEAAG